MFRMHCTRCCFCHGDMVRISLLYPSMLGTQLQCLCFVGDALCRTQSQNLIPFLEIPLQKEVDSPTSKTIEMGQESKPK